MGIKVYINKNIKAAPQPVGQKLKDLIDVDASDADNNEILVYDEVNDKYVVEALPRVNGGTY